jgi:hypothetical protein
MPVVNTRQINGVVRTSEPVWSNLERLAEACTSWFTYDVHSGLYSWVINEAGNSTASISEADIIGPIQISGSGVNNLYNAIEIEYPNTEIRDQPHYVRLELPPNLRNAYEPDNTLQITSEFINNQPQAEYNAMVNLKQSRLDRTITINMDYTKINIRAGDIIDVTSDTYGWTAKEFRVMRVREIEGDDGSLRLEFSCSEYDDTIYDGTWAQFLVGGPPGIISIGAIGAPGTPTVVATTLDSLPAQAVTSTVPTGIVDRMQFWAGNIAATGNINNTAFDLYGTVASTDADSFTTGGNVIFTTTSLSDGTWVWKTRGINVNGTGPFSNVSGNVAYTRNQAPDVIRIGTPIVDSNGNIFTGGGTMMTVSYGSDTWLVPQSANTSAPYSTGTANFIAPVSGDYKVDVIFELNGSGATGGRGSPYGEPLDYMGGIVQIAPTANTANLIYDQNSGGAGSRSWEDYVMSGIVTLDAGTEYSTGFSFINFTQSANTANANVTVSHNIYTVKPD